MRPCQLAKLLCLDRSAGLRSRVTYPCFETIPVLGIRTVLAVAAATTAAAADKRLAGWTTLTEISDTALSRDVRSHVPRLSPDSAGAVTSAPCPDTGAQWNDTAFRQGYNSGICPFPADSTRYVT